MKRELQKNAKALVAFLAEGDGWPYCEVCKRNGMDTGFHIHHIKLRSQGGNHSVKNIIHLCRECHDDAHGKGANDCSKARLYQIANERNERWNPKH